MGIFAPGKTERHKNPRHSRGGRIDGGYILLDALIALLLIAVGFSAALSAVSRGLESSIEYRKTVGEIIMLGNDVYSWPDDD